jgi:hypothetical protein
MGCALSTEEMSSEQITQEMSSVEIRQRKRTMSDRIADSFRRKKSNAFHPAYFQANVDRGNDSLSVTTSFRKYSPEEQKDDISTGRPECVFPSRKY